MKKLFTKRNGIIATVTAVALAILFSVQPGQKIQDAINSAAAGDVVEVAPGTYGESLNVKAGVNVVCQTKFGCVIKRAVLNSNSTLNGFYSLNNDSNDGGIVGNGSGYKILNNKVERSCMVGIKLNGSNGLAEGNDVSKSRQCPNSSGPDADGFRAFGSNHIMRGNYIHDINFGGANVDPHIDCFQTWSGASNLLIENNVCDNYVASTTGKEGSQGANMEDCNGCTFKNNYFHVYGKGILFESSSSSSRADNNIFILGSKIQGATSGQYGLFGAMSANNNLFWLYPNASETLVAGASGTGNINNKDPQMSGYCSLAYPERGIPCGAVPPTATAGPTQTPTITRTPTVTPTASATRTPTVTGSPTATRTATSTRTATTIPTVTRTATATATRTATATITSTSTVSPTARMCLQILWKTGLNIRPVPSLFSSPLTTKGYPENMIVPVESLIPGYMLVDGEKVIQGTFAVINWGQFIPINSLGITFSKVVDCPS